MSSANDRIKELEQRLTEAEKIAKRYHDMYVKEKEQQSQGNKSSQSQSKPAATDESEPTDQADDQLNNNDDRKWLTDADLDDDEAVRYWPARNVPSTGIITRYDISSSTRQQKL